MSLSFVPSVPVRCLVVSHSFALCHSSGVKCFIELQVSINWLSFVVCAQSICIVQNILGWLSKLNVAIVTD